MKSRITVLMLLALLIFSCNSVEPEYKPIEVNIESLADYFGNRDGETTAAEISSLTHYFFSHTQLLFIRGEVDRSLMRQKASDILDNFRAVSEGYPTKESLQIAYRDSIFFSEAVSIMQFNNQGEKIVFNKYYRAPGASIYGSAWYNIELY